MRANPTSARTGVCESPIQSPLLELTCVCVCVCVRCTFVFVYRYLTCTYLVEFAVVVLTIEIPECVLLLESVLSLTASHWVLATRTQKASY
jgi:hypothetical protein